MSLGIPLPSLTFFPLARTRTVPALVATLGVCARPTDPIGTHTLTLTNVAVGSRIAIRDQAGTTSLHDAVAAASTVVIPLSVYASGSSLNDWRIRIRKASGSPNYIPYETLMTAAVGSSSIYVSQIPDE